MSSATPDRHPRATAITPARPRAWPALLVLLLLPGITAETLSASTPIIAYLTNPFNLLSNTLLYGSAAILIREVARRRGLGWASILWLGTAFGVFEEGLVVNTWANPWQPQVCRIANGTAIGLCDYSRVAGITLAWAVSTMVFHAVIAVATPILLVELLFTRLAAAPWLGRKAPLVFGGAELLVLGLGVSANIADFERHGLPGPFAEPYVIEIALMVLLVVLALGLRSDEPAARAERASGPPRPPHLWTLRLVGFIALLVALADVMFPTALAGGQIPFPVALAAQGALLGLIAWRVATWARRPGWDDRHRLALASGALGFFLLVWDPIFELAGTAGGGSTRGTAAVALAYLILLIVLARRSARASRAGSALAITASRDTA